MQTYKLIIVTDERYCYVCNRQIAPTPAPAYFHKNIFICPECMQKAALACPELVQSSLINEVIH